MSTLNEIYEVPIGDINISERNVRLTHPERDLEELADSIRLHGLLQPVVLSGEYGSPPYDLISGQRRYLAHARFLRVPTIRAVFAGVLTPTEALIRSLVENLQRADLEFQDTSRAVTALFNEMGSVRRVKEVTGLSIRRIRDHLLIEARASEKMKAQLRDGKVSAADVKRALQAAQENVEKAERLLDMMIELSPTTHQKRRLVNYGEADSLADAETIFQKAMKPHVERKLVIALTDDIRNALERATAAKEMEASDLAEQILSEWLLSEGFSELVN
ncbi:MAG: ParB/RepB/Spo0J family partition protein [Verrucomicrobia bacterium]|nr:ParB/RepB/Spo0J family partition protein [Verrucomicrobiota bacterium]